MLLDRFLPRIEFDSYEDFKANYKVNVPENFNFGFDIVDAWADSEPEKKALVSVSYTHLLCTRRKRTPRPAALRRPRCISFWTR